MAQTHRQTPVEKPPSRYTLSYGMRLDKVKLQEPAHAQASLALPDGSAGRMTLHVSNGTADEIKAQLLERVDAFFQAHAVG
jgi:hypothetical protein